MAFKGVGDTEPTSQYKVSLSSIPPEIMQTAENIVNMMTDVSQDNLQRPLINKIQDFVNKSINEKAQSSTSDKIIFVSVNKKVMSDIGNDKETGKMIYNAAPNRLKNFIPETSIKSTFKSTIYSASYIGISKEASDDGEFVFINIPKLYKKGLDGILKDAETTSKGYYSQAGRENERRTEEMGKGFINDVIKHIRSNYGKK